MTITLATNQESQLTVFKVVGSITYKEGMEALRSFYEKHLTRNVLWDFNEGNLAAISTEQMKSFADYVSQQGKLRAGGKTAFVAPKDLEYGLLRMLNTIGEFNEIPFQTMVFRSMDQAIAWIEKDDESKS